MRTWLHEATNSLKVVPKERNKAKSEEKLKFVKALIRAGFPMQALDLKFKMPIEYLLEKNNQDTFYKVLECYLQAGFDVFAQPVDYIPGKTGSVASYPFWGHLGDLLRERGTKSFWEVLNESNMCTP